MYGLHQACRYMFEKLHHKFISNRFSEIPGLTRIYHYNKEAIIMVCIHDFPIYAKDKNTLTKVTHLLKSLYDVENLGPITQFLGIKFHYRMRML